MTEKELKKLNRKQLLELLLRQTEHAEALENELEETKKRLENKIILQSEAGSVAEASLRLNNVFESAQKAADQYLENVKILSKKNAQTEKELNEEKARLAEEKKALEEERIALEKEKFELMKKYDFIPLVDETTDEEKPKQKKAQKKSNVKPKNAKKKKRK